MNGNLLFGAWLDMYSSVREYIGKVWSKWGTHCGTMDLSVVFIIKFKEVLFQNKFKNLFKVSDWYW